MTRYLSVIFKSEPYLLLTSADCIDYKTGLVFSQQFPNEIINFRFTVIWFVVIVAITHNKPSSQHLNLLRPFKMFSAIKRWIFCQEVKKASKQYTSRCSCSSGLFIPFWKERMVCIFCGILLIIEVISLWS